MKLISITVYNYENRHGMPYKMKVDAFCVGGKEGVFAVFQIPISSRWVGFANGDDGHWQLSGIFSKEWVKDIVNALNASNE